jgi:hypothetical protein
MIYRDKENKGSITLTHRVKMFLKQYKKLVMMLMFFQDYLHTNRYILIPMKTLSSKIWKLEQ